MIKTKDSPKKKPPLDKPIAKKKDIPEPMYKYGVGEDELSKANHK